MTKLQAIRWFMNELCGEWVILARERCFWGCAIPSKTPRFVLPVDLDENTQGDKAFRADFVKRYPSAQGFANITITILHEVGHWFTREEFDYIAYAMRRLTVRSDADYFAIPEEHMATEWAIEWLQDPQHRKFAKHFEKEYFGYGKD